MEKKRKGSHVTPGVKIVLKMMDLSVINPQSLIFRAANLFGRKIGLAVKKKTRDKIIDAAPRSARWIFYRRNSEGERK